MPQRVFLKKDMVNSLNGGQKFRPDSSVPVNPI